MPKYKRVEVDFEKLKGYRELHKKQHIMRDENLENIEFKNQLKAFKKRKIDEGKSLSNVGSTSAVAKEFLLYLEQQNINQFKSVSKSNIDNYFNHLKQRKNKRRSGGLSAGTLIKHREGILRFMEFIQGVNTGESGYHITIFINNRIPKPVLTEDEIAILFNQTEPTIDGLRNRAILSLLYGCGLRKSELYRLNIEDINSSKDTIRIKKSKNSFQRDVPMTAQIKTNLEDYIYEARVHLLKEHHHEPAFLLNNLGDRLSLEGIHYKVKTMGEQSGILKPISAHQLRHAIATHLMENQFTIEEIAQFLGHKNLDSTQVYTHIQFNKTNYYAKHL